MRCCFESCFFEESLRCVTLLCRMYLRVVVAAFAF